jgi:parallel beta-helix repeat protein
MKPKKLWPLVFVLACNAGVNAQTNLALLVSQPGDYVGDGQTHITTNLPDTAISGTPNELSFWVFDYSIYFSGPDKTPLSVGTYTNAAKWPVNGAQPGLNIYGNGRSCSALCGEFRIFELHTNLDGKVDRFWATFAQICGCSGTSMTGEIRYHSQLAPAAPVPRTLRVPDDFATIQAALNDASLLTTDTILVGPGTYKESIEFAGKNARLLSTGGPSLTFIAPPSRSTAVKFRKGETPDALLCGFTLTNCDSGIEINGASPTITSNVFVEYFTGISGDGGSPAILYNQFIGFAGFGIFLRYAANPVICGNTILSNVVYGVGISDTSYATICNNVFRGNYIAVYIYGDSGANIIQNQIVQNSEGVNAGVSRGLWLINNTIAFNECVGLNIAGSYIQIANNIIVGEPTLNLVGLDYRSQVQVIANDIYSPTGNLGNPDVARLIGVNGNISADPQFVCFQNGNFRLKPGSPCIDAGSNDPVARFLDTDLEGKPRFVNGQTNGFGIVDMGALEFDVTQPVPPVCLYLDCPSNIVIHVPAGQDSATITFPQPNAPLDALVTFSPLSGTTFLLGTNFASCTATLAGNTQTCVFTVVVLAAPPNDEFENAEAISSLPYETTVDLAAATRAAIDTDCWDAGPTVWYKFKSKKDQEIIITGTVVDEGSSPVMEVFTQDRKALRQVWCGLDFFQFKALAGHTYYIMLAALDPEFPGKARLTVSSQPLLRVRATLASTALIDSKTGAINFSGVITSTRQAVVGVQGTVWLGPGSSRPLGRFWTSMMCQKGITRWNASCLTSFPPSNPTLRVSISYFSGDYYLPISGRLDQSVLVIPQAPGRQ